ncbi:pfkB family carbohydrate kinase [compost metagenome]
MKRLGHQVTYITSVGNDPFGRRIEQFLKESGLDTTCLTWMPKAWRTSTMKQG